MKKATKNSNFIFLLGVSFFCLSAAYSQEEQPEGESNLANAVQNPVADIVSIPFKTIWILMLLTETH